ncbi:MAG: hypothetical protein DDT42_00558 [candidate division WS2 bacterium]|uniref:PrcB C-terminal domain-containing protein n=1 Tax=Psychracetigena formicireducens TaxID=2986056 RepID=A0A9E2BGY6_PSYF1|nr:hypothetical protein [Candidatus Psychracetigena formicireducens]MBT9144712.1 hypothetical protein [Candidatus Psychracetigena formicireducens]
MKLTKKRFLGLVVVCFIILSGYYSLLHLRSDEITPDKVIYERPVHDKLPREIQNWIGDSKELFLSQKRVFEGNTYILVTWGRKNTAGYSVKIDEVFNENSKLVLSMLFENPPADSMVAQVLTFPYDLIVIDYEVSEVEFRSKEIEEYIPSLVGVPYVKGICAQSANIKLFEPSFSGTKKRNIHVDGIIWVFEATYQYRIVDFNGVEVVSGFSMAKAGGPDWGYFNLFLTIPETAPKGEYSLEVFTLSFKDGSKQDTVRVIFNIE